MSRALSLPSNLGPGNVSADPDNSIKIGSARKYSHVRAQLGVISRQGKLDPYDGDEGEPIVDAALVTKVVKLLSEEREDELKELLCQEFMLDEDAATGDVLDLMHKHHDDIAGVPFLLLTPSRRISRPSSRASNQSTRFNRPETPSSTPGSPLASILKRPHTPLGSPLTYGQGTSYMTARTESPAISPILAHAQATQAHAQYTASLPSSPVLGSRGLLSAKASEFKPIPRPLSSASSNPGFSTSYLSGLRAETPSPDMWSHNSPRATSNLAIAAPLFPDRTSHRMMRTSSLRAVTRPIDYGDEGDPYDPYSSYSPPDEPGFTVTDFDGNDPWHNSSVSNISLSPRDSTVYHEDPQSFEETYDFNRDFSSSDNAEMEAETVAGLTDGMAPFDVLTSVFGSTIASSELEEALATNGYDFERAMAWLVDQSSNHIPDSGAGQVGLASRDLSNVSKTTRYQNGRQVPGGNRVCRYFVAGECLRADCRFSHDLERALCRFWLRGTCAKGDQCEFLHHLPKDAYVSRLTSVLNRTHISPAIQQELDLEAQRALPHDDFPVLGFDNARSNRVGYNVDKAMQDPSRTRFANAVKKSVNPLQAQADDVVSAARREAMGKSAEPLHHRSAVVAPRPSPRQKLRPPSLLPTLPTGESVNSMYMKYRSRALHLGASRNACLQRAAEAWRRGDGAAAKRFSREGQDLNIKMSAEMTDAASQLVRARATIAEKAVKTREPTWSNDPGDRTSRGRICGGGLGICLGISSREVGGGKLTPEERAECMLDLHGLHSTEATEVLEQFLLAIEKEHFYGLAYLVIGEEKHTGSQDPARGASRARLATGVKEWLHRWGYPWSERDGIICVDAITHE